MTSFSKLNFKPKKNNLIRVKEQINEIEMKIEKIDGNISLINKRYIGQISCEKDYKQNVDSFVSLKESQEQNSNKIQKIENNLKNVIKSQKKKISERKMVDVNYSNFNETKKKESKIQEKTEDKDKEINLREELILKKLQKLDQGFRTLKNQT